jgi:heme exporter protein CcmD
MNAWPFVIAAYALTVGATLGLLIWSWAAMRRAEAEAARLSARP